MNIQDTLSTQLFTSVALMSSITYIGYQLKSIPEIVYKRIERKLIYSVRIEETTDLYKYVEKWLQQNHSNSFKNVLVSLDSENKLYTERKESAKPYYSHYNDIFIFKYNQKKIFIEKDREKMQISNSDNRRTHYSSYSIKSWMGKNVISELIQDIINHGESVLKESTFIYYADSSGYWEQFSINDTKKLDNVFLSNKNIIVDDIQSFINNEKWYAERGLNYRRGYLFYGIPGNGKTSMCIALANHFNKNIFIMTLNDYSTDNKLIESFKNLKQDTILLIEDIDSIFNQRKTQKASISFSTLLNCIDGVFSKKGIIIFFTTNYIEKIDSALIREGRVDMKIEFCPPTKELVENYISVFYNIHNIKLPKYNKSLSMCTLQEICISNRHNLENTIQIISN